ncbi:hypothetical protein [Lederbergia citrea]|uniref:Uncharacterized protein n=1 Tax=Lederbergia citrea TaxID=2833581 RepID=A0A942UNR1_9BACI|nr:hypothetical protein [Lederbergia citrea]MBS4223222.1 hypothetical protein [Lederbergia citrea]
MNIDEKLDLILKKLDEHGTKLDEHSRILGALIHGQEELKANLEGFKLETYKQFGEIKAKQDAFEKKQDTFDAKLELLETRTWKTETDTHRLKKIAGIE